VGTAHHPAYGNEEKSEVPVQTQVVESTSLSAVGYDPANLTLEVQFKSGEVYRYFNVPYVVVEQLMTAGSVGRYFAKQVRNRFRSRRIDGGEGNNARRVVQDE
jgi:hypothetical protein